MRRDPVLDWRDPGDRHAPDPYHQLGSALEIFMAAQEKLLLSSRKPHYLFNLLDVWKVSLGLFLTIEHVISAQAAAVPTGSS